MLDYGSGWQLLMMYPGTNKHKQIGFSMIELLTSIAIVGILLTLALPSYTTWIENGQIRTGAEAVFNGLNLARSRAIQTNQPVQFKFDTTSNNTGWVFCELDTPGSTTFSKNCKNNATQVTRNAQIGTSNIMGDLTSALAVGLGSGADNVIFDGMGRTNSLVRVDVVNPKLDTTKMRRLVMQISIGGQVRLCDPDVGLSSNDPRRCT
jgi:type IV fimbrial biogenesis protein FimT